MVPWRTRVKCKTMALWESCAAAYQLQPKQQPAVTKKPRELTARPGRAGERRWDDASPRNRNWRPAKEQRTTAQMWDQSSDHPLPHCGRCAQVGAQLRPRVRARQQRPYGCAPHVTVPEAYLNGSEVHHLVMRSETRCRDATRPRSLPGSSREEQLKAAVP